MQTHSVATPPILPYPNRGQGVRRKAVNPPVLTLTHEEGSTTSTHPVFGRIPRSFKLEGQLIQMLEFWLRKANAAIDALPETVTDVELNAACKLQRDIYAAIVRYEPRSSSDVALMMRAITLYADQLKTNEIEDVLSMDQLRTISQHLTAVTAPIVPAKRPGPLERGRKLTRAGLLFRMQSYLVKELETISWHLYGDSHYLFQQRSYDRAVDERCRGKKHSYPFFDETKLSKRARSVLKSLGIDTERNDDVQMKKGAR